ncbi:MAG TPA: DUF2231 domain-containing protein [Polyangiaceae bacterium]|nr:DUF2231 domain-containing protein [Polyangiaceae bacterium]
MTERRVTRVLGHPLHAMLTDFPLALLVATPLFDLASLWVSPELALVAYWCEFAGLVSAAVAALAGVADLVRLETPSDAMTTALRHAGLALIAVTAYVVAFVLRTRGALAPMAVIGLELLGLACIGAAGWFGGHLVFHHGVGVKASNRTR